MDVFYYWKDFSADMKAGKVGRFRSAKDRLDELQEGFPSYIWTFKTPTGRKGELQLLSRLVWSDKSLIKFTPISGDSQLFYDPDHKDSVWFEGTDSDAVIEETTRWIRTHIPAAHASNFQGVNGQHAMRGLVVSELNTISKTLNTRPFRSSPATEASLSRNTR